ncbi:MAG TPA: TolC family protein, partial [Fluviicola sp.]|nr:TolC family protein [Fluviicola sp.]
RKAEIDMAKTNTAIAEIEFQKLLLELKYQLHISLFQAGQQQLLIQKYNKQLQFLDTLIQAFRVQVEKGNIPMNEFVRLKGAYIQLNNERANLIQEFYQTQTTIQTLLQVTSIVIPKEDQLDFSVYLNIQPVEDLIQLAKSQQLDLQIIHQNQILAQQYLMYQKRVAIPDINIFVSYDQRGGAFNNQLNTGISIPLPIWNRNRGAIKSAQLETQELEYTLKSRELELTNAIRNTYAAYKQTISEYVHTKELYNDDFEKVQQGMSMNFQKRNISLIEFMDFFESYNQVINELSRIKTQLVINAEQFTILTGKELFKP